MQCANSVPSPNLEERSDPVIWLYSVNRLCGWLAVCGARSCNDGVTGRDLPNAQQGLRIFVKYLFHELHSREVTATFLSTFFSES
jgi:hypothetical protein